MYSQPRCYIQGSDQFHTPVALSPEKEHLVVSQGGLICMELVSIGYNRASVMLHALPTASCLTSEAQL
jgi:hypothetical protein